MLRMINHRESKALRKGFKALRIEVCLCLQDKFGRVLLESFVRRVLG